jgi:tRNA-specific 2-thiouridylase
MAERVLVAMSGGVDSSVAAARLVDEGHEVAGVTLKLWGGPSDSGCCSVADVEDARRVAAQLGIPHYVFNLTDAFERHVVDPYVDAHAHARTPNPCVECNRAIKFGALFERMHALGFDALATGHHARVVRTDRGPRLARGHDRAKDQSYVLYMLGRRHLERTRLPVGEMTKADVRAEAARRGLRTATKAESMDVCFITRGDRLDFLAQRMPSRPRPGAIVDVDGAPIGQHDGAERFTIGQRRGTGVAAGERRFVVDVDATTATVTMGRREDLLREAVELDDLVIDPSIDSPARVVAQSRAHGDPVPARLQRGEGARATVEWETPQSRVAPGQVVALYDGDLLVGGGIATG